MKTTPLVLFLILATVSCSKREVVKGDPITAPALFVCVMDDPEINFKTKFKYNLSLQGRLWPSPAIGTNRINRRAIFLWQSTGLQLSVTNMETVTRWSTATSGTPVLITYQEVFWRKNEKKKLFDGIEVLDISPSTQ